MAAVGIKTGMKIGVLAGRSGLPVKTLRYYEDLGLLPAIGRSEGGYRLFADRQPNYRQRKRFTECRTIQSRCKPNYIKR
jgi:DNA-binding transcriptional MerR regulator